MARIQIYLKWFLKSLRLSTKSPHSKDPKPQEEAEQAILINFQWEKREKEGWLVNIHSESWIFYKMYAEASARYKNEWLSPAHSTA